MHPLFDALETHLASRPPQLLADGGPVLREAAVLAGLVPDSMAGRARVHFVTEGEASLHFCIQSGLTSETIEVRGDVPGLWVAAGFADVRAR